MVKKLDYWLYAFIFIHVIAWTLAPSLVRFTLPMDAMEGATWGHQLEWGYDKNPFMNGWLTTLAIKLGGHSGWMVYFFSQVSVGLCFWAVWQLGKKMISPIYAVAAILSLEGIQYYNLHAIDFNDNTLELGFWALTILFFYRAVREKNYLNWVLVGIFAAFSMMIKYYTALLLLPLFLFFMANKDARENIKNPAFYLSLVIFLVICTPHVVWLFSHHFITVMYAFNRVSSPPSWLNHIFYPAQFAWQMLEAFLPAGILLLILFPFTHRKIENDPLISTSSHKKTPLGDGDGLFIFLIAFGPFLLTLLLSTLFGMKLRAGWGQPLLTFWGFAILAWLQPVISSKRFYSFVVAVFLFMGLLVAGYSIALTRAKDSSSANFPGKNISVALTTEWHEKFHTPIQYIAGARDLAGNIAFFSPDQPTVYIDWDNNVSSWIDENKLKQAGAIFVWNLSDDKVSYAEVKKRFPNIGTARVMKFEWMRNKDMAPVEIKVAFLPPVGVSRK